MEDNRIMKAKVYISDYLKGYLKRPTKQLEIRIDDWHVYFNFNIDDLEYFRKCLEGSIDEILNKFIENKQ